MFTYPDYYPWYYVTLSDSSVTFTTGTHAISFVAYDGAFHVTNSLTFEVLSVRNAIEELIVSVQAAIANSGAGFVIAPLRSAHDAVNNRDFASAIFDLHDFERRLDKSIGWYDSRRPLLHDAAEVILAGIGEYSFIP
jgi:hypothetical protein